MKYRLSPWVIPRAQVYTPPLVTIQLQYSIAMEYCNTVGKYCWVIEHVRYTLGLIVSADQAQNSQEKTSQKQAACLNDQKLINSCTIWAIVGLPVISGIAKQNRQNKTGKTKQAKQNRQNKTSG